MNQSAFHYFTIFCTVFAVLLIVFSYCRKTKFQLSDWDIIPYHGNTKDWTLKIPYPLCILLLLCIGSFLRLYRLDAYPAGFHVDEAGMAYDAFCLANYGTERFLHKFPVYLINYSGGQSVMYAYLCSLLFRFFGVSLVTIRLPAALAGVAVILVGALLAEKLFGQKIAFLTAFLITTCPYFIMSSRVALDCDLLLSFSMLALYAFICAQEKQNIFLYMLTGILFGLCLYTYSLSWLILPVFLIILIPYTLVQKKLTFRQLTAMAVPMGILAVPLLLFVYINTFQLPEIVTPFFTVPRLPYYRMSDLKLTNLYDMIERLWYIISTDHTNIFAYDGYYTLYMMSIPFLIYGFSLVKRHTSLSMHKMRNEYINYLFFFFLAALLCAALQNATNLYRSNSIYFSLAAFTAVAILYTCRYLKHPRILLGILIGMYSVHAASFCGYYYSGQVQEDHPIVWFTYDYLDDIYRYLHENNVTEEVYIDDYNLTTYCYAMLEYEVDPYEFAEYGNVADTYDFNYKNLHFYLPDDLSDVPGDAIYIVMDYNQEAMDYLGGNGDFETASYGYYTIFYPSSAM